MAKSIFQVSPVEAEISKQEGALSEIDMRAPDLPDIPAPAPLPAAPLPAARSVMPASGGKPAPELFRAFEAAAIKHNVPVNVLMALGEQESRYNPVAVGTPTQWGRAKGLMQYLDSTARGMGINPFDPVQSIDAAAKQLRERLAKGYSMRDAVMEHHGGTDRRQWGPKTARYGEEVLGRAARLKKELTPRYAPASGPWYSPGATADPAPQRPVSARAIAAATGATARKPASSSSLVDSIEDPNSMPAILASREAERTRNPSEGSISATRAPAPTLGNALRGAVTSAGEAFQQARDGIRMQAQDLAGGAIDDWIDRNMDAPGLSLEGQRAQFGRTNTQQDFERSQARSAASTPQFESWWADAAYGGLQSLIQTAPGVAAGIVAGPAVGLAVLGGQTEAQSYGKYRARGAESGMALLGAVGEGGVEVATEMLPMGWLTDKFGKVGFGQFLTSYFAREMPTEQVATFAQDAIDTAIANPDKTWGDFWNERLDAAGKTAVATLMQTGAFAGLNTAVEKIARDDVAAAVGADQTAIAPQPQQENGTSAVKPAMPAPVGDPIAQPDTPTGPLGRAAALAPIAPAPEPSIEVPAPLAEDAPRQQLRLITPAGEIPVSLIGETTDAVWVRGASGDEMQIPRSEIDAGSVQLVAPTAPATGKPDLQVEPAPTPPPPQALTANDAADLPAGMRGFAEGISAGLIDMYHQQARAGSVKDKAGATSSILQVAKQVRALRGGAELARDEVEAIARAVDTVPGTGAERQTALRAVVASFAGNEAIDPETGEVLSAEAPPPSVAPARVDPATDVANMDEAQLRERLQYLASQARTNAGWSKPLLAEKKKVSAAIDALTAVAAPPSNLIEQAAAEAATSPLNDLAPPTEAQKEAGNYKKGHVAIGGLDVSIENPAGTSRRPEWPPLKHSYGYVKRSEGADGDHVDVFLGPNAADPANPVFIVDQVNADGSFDEHKVMLGFKDVGTARRGYRANYAKGWKGDAAITEMPFEAFKAWVRDPAITTKPAAAIVVAPGAPVGDIGAQIDGPSLPRGEVTEPAAVDGVVDVGPPTDLPPPPASSSAALPITEPALPSSSATVPLGQPVAQRPTDKKNPNPYVRKGERFRFVEQVGYLGGNSDDSYSIDSVSKKEAWFVNDRTGGRSSLANYEMQGALRRGVLARVAAPVEPAAPGPDNDEVAKKVEAIHRRLADRVTPSQWINDHVVTGRETAGVIDPKGHILALKATTNPAGDHAEFFEALQAPGLVPDDFTGYVRITAYGNQVGTAADGAITDAQRAAATAVRNIAVRSGIRYIGLEGDADVKTEPPELASKTNDIEPEVNNAPAVSIATPSAAFSKNKLFTVDKVEAARARLREKMGRINSGVDPEALIDGMVIAGAYIEAGVRKFADYAEAMRADFGPRITPYLLSFWEGARNYPGIDTKGMTAPDASRAEYARLLEQGLPAEEAEALGTEVAPPAKARPKAKGSRSLRDDWGVSTIDGRSPLSGGRNEETDEGLKGGAKDAFLSDAVAYLRAVAAELKQQGFVPHLNTKGKEQNPISRNVGGPAGSGDVSLTMSHAETGALVYATIGATAMRGAVPSNSAGVAIMYRVSRKAGDKYATAGVNRWAPADLTAIDLADTIAWEVGRGKPELTRDVTEPEPAGRSDAGGGASSAEVGRNADPQQGASPASADVVANEQPEDVGQPASAGPDREAGVRGATANVVPAGGTDSRGDAGDRRAGAGGARRADAGAGKPAGRSDGDGRLDLLADVGKKVESGLRQAPSPAHAGPGNFLIANPLDIVGGGPVARFDRNRQAIETYNAIRDEGRAATADEQRVLAGYTGWGSFGQELFQGTWDRPMPKESWQARDGWLRDHMGREEWESAQRSITNAHYTDPPTVMAMWAMMQRMGFEGGRVLEPSMGIGNFFGMMPAAIAARSQLAGIELDSLTGGMAGLLYPDANVRVMGYQDSKTPDGFYDAVIGNWPFENTVIADRRYDRLSPYLHDYFFLKAVDQVRAGGIVMGITSSGTMDKKATGIRRELAKKAELVAAFRLPSGAFAEYAGTKVVTDIVILRKRAEPIALADKEGWIDSVPFQTPNGEVYLNEYYVANPAHVVGKVDFGHGTTRGRPGLIVHRPDDMQAQLQRIVQAVPEGAYAREDRSAHISYTANHTADREGALTKTSAGLFIVRGEHLAPAADVAAYALKDAAKTAARVDQLERLIAMRQAYGALIDADRAGDAAQPRKALRAAYDGFVKAHGSLGASFGLSYLRKIDDPFYPALGALETDSKPAAILSRSTTRGAPAIDNPSIADAFVLERNASVNPSIDSVARRASVAPEAAKAELLASGAVYELPSGDVLPSDMYLSGNVREKLRQARDAVAEGMPHLQRNVDALVEVVPADIPYFKIEVQLGATWVSTDIYGQFIGHMLGLDESKGVEVRYSGGRWSVRIDDRLKARTEAHTGFGTNNYSFQRLVNAAFSNQAVTIRRKDSDGKEYVDSAATEEVNGKIAEMRTKFGEWLWSDPERRVAVEAEYNEVRNAFATPRFDGSFLRFEGMALSLGNGPFDLRQHQVDAVWRALVTRRSLNAHEVGTGKTFTMGGIAVESRRYGIARKPLILAHNANSKTVAAEIQQMYPAAKILYIDNLTPDTIDVKMRQIANDDWDAVVVPHSLIDRFAFREDTLMEMAREEIAALEEEAYLAAGDDNVTIKAEMWDDPEELKKLRSPTAKELVKMRQRIIETIRKQSNRASREGAISFEELGVDMLMVDEAHEFKKPPISTRMKMKGLNTQTSDRSIALSFLTRYVRANNAGGNVHLFTGTPITNTLTEIFHMMRYMMAEEMQAAGVDQWDGWFGSFAREVMDVEQNAAAEYEAVTRLAGFINVPELRRMIGQYMDVVFADDMPEMQPRRTASGKTMADALTEAERGELLNGRTEKAMDRPYKRVINVTSDLTPQQKIIFDQLRGYARSWRQMSGKDRRDAMQSGAPESPIITEGLATKASFDVRLMQGEGLAGQEGQAFDDPGSKASRVVANVKEIYDSHAQATQVIFAEQGFSTRVTRSLGRDDNGKRLTRSIAAFSTIRDIIERLVAAGIPRDQIAIVDGSTSKDKRKEIALKMNAAKIRVVIGSTSTLGVGVNMQKNLRAMHHVDAPWMPGDLEQRNGRGQRQGNQWNTVLEYRYLTDRLDGRRWQVLAIKQRFITAFLKSDDSARVIEGEAAADEQSDILQSFAEAAGDPRILIREKLRKRLDAAQRRERLHTQGIANAIRQARRMEKSADEEAREIASIDERGTATTATRIITENAGKAFSATIAGQTIDKRRDADDAIQAWAAKNMRIGDAPKPVGQFGGQELTLAWPEHEAKPHLRLALDGRDFVGGGIQGLEISLRSFGPNVEKRRAQLDSDRASITRLRALAQEPFHMAGELARYEKALADLEMDVKANPVPPPAWLRTGAPVDTELFWQGELFTVTGHRWTADGWFVLAEDGAGQTSIPYLEVKDRQGIALYDERPFEAPEIIEMKAAGQAADSRLDPETPAAHSIGGLTDGGFASVAGLRQHLAESSFGTVIGRLIEAGKIVLHDNASTLPGGMPSAQAPLDQGKQMAIVPAGTPPLGDSFNQRRGRAKAAARRLHADKSYRNEEQGREIAVNAASIAHSLDKTRSIDDLALAMAIPDLLRAAVLVRSQPGRTSRLKHDFYAAARMADGSLRRVKITVLENDAGMLMYAQHVVGRLLPVIEGVPGPGAGSLDGSSPTGKPGTSIKIGDLLHGVKHGDGTRLFSRHADGFNPAEPSSAGNSIQGMTARDGVIHLVAEHLTSRTALPVLLHEVFHSGVRSLIGNAGWNATLARVGALYRAAAAREAGGERGNSVYWTRALARVEAAGPPIGQEVEEFAAYAIEERAQAPAAVMELADRLIGAFKAWMLRRFGVQLGALTPSQIQSLAAAALRAQTLAPRDVIASDAFYSRVVPSADAIDAATPGFIHNLVTRSMDGPMSVLGVVPLRPLLSEMASQMPAAQEYLVLKQEMDTTRDQWHARADAVAQPWLKFRVLHSAENTRLMDLMHEATLSGVDPAKPFTSILTKVDREILAEGPGTDAYEAAAEKAERDKARKAEHDRLAPLFAALSAEAQRIYVEVRDTYGALSDDFERTLLENLSKALDIKMRQAERAFDAEMIRIVESRMSKEAASEAVSAAERDMAIARQTQGWSKGARMTRLRHFFETNTLSGPYFPLARFGNFFVTVRDAGDDVISFSRFEKPAQQQAFAAEMRAAGHDVAVGVLEDGGQLRAQVDARFVTDIEDILEGADVSDTVRDAVWQRWLESMPDMSIRTSRIHRKGRAGFSNDALRAFGHHMFHGAHQIARLKYSLDMDETLALGRDQAKTMPDPVRSGLIVNEMARRHQFIMNPTGGPLAQMVTSAAFVYFLAVTPAAALVNTAQTAVLGVPILAAYDGRAGTGMARASFEINRALRDFTTGLGHAANAKRLSDDERKAMDAAYLTGLIERTQSHDLAGVGETGVRYSPVRTKVMAAISWSFHHTERMNREITFLAAYRMARKKAEPHDMAIETAAKLTWKIHFDYQNTSRPRIMQGDTAKVLFVFRNFNVNMLWRLFRDAHQAVKGGTKSERREALTQLAGTTGMMMLSAGIRGTWLYGIAIVFATLLFGDDAEDDFKKAIVETLGSRLGGMALNGVPGHAAGVDISSRIGMPDLWFRSPDRELEGATEFDYWAMQVLGAGVGALRNLWTGTSMIRDGHVERGAETIAPKFVKDQMRALRYMSEGARTLKGDAIMEEMDAAAAVKQSLGFTPAELAERYERNRSMKNREQRILDARTTILSDFDRVQRAGEDAAEVEARIAAFNEGNPDYPITVKSVRQSMRSRQQMRDRKVGGVYLNPRLVDRLNDEAPPLLYKDEPVAE